jgi:hypothetical protein
MARDIAIFFYEEEGYAILKHSGFPLLEQGEVVVFVNEDSGATYDLVVHDIDYAPSDGSYITLNISDEGTDRLAIDHFINTHQLSEPLSEDDREETV